MLKRLTKHGNELALVLDKPVRDLLGLNTKTPISLTLEGKTVVITPVRPPKPRKDSDKLIARINRDCKPARRRLTP